MKGYAVAAGLLLAALGCQPSRPERSALDAELEAPTTQVTSGRSGDDQDPEVSPDGTRLYYVSSSFGETLDLYVREIGSNVSTRLTTLPGDKRFPRVNPADPKRLAFSTNARGTWEIALVSLNDPQARVEYVSESGAQSLHPSWSPDGRKLVYSATAGIASDEWTLRVYDLESRRTTVLADVDGLLPNWSPRGDRIVFQRMKHRDAWLGGLWTVELAGGAARNLTMIFSSDEWAAINPAWSPDGRHVVFATIGKARARATQADRGDDLWMIDADGSHPTRLTTSPASEWMPVWAADGTIYFTSDRSGSNRIWSLRAPVRRA